MMSPEGPASLPPATPSLSPSPCFCLSHGCPGMGKCQGELGGGDTTGQNRTISWGQSLKRQEGRSPQGSSFNKRFFPREGEGGGEGERDLFKATLLLWPALSVCQGLQLPQTGRVVLRSSW